MSLTDEPKKMQGDVNPRKVFYIAVEIGNRDGSADVDWDGSKGYQDEPSALEYAVGGCEEHGAEYIIVECIPIKRVTRPKPKVEVLLKEKAKVKR